MVEPSNSSAPAIPTGASPTGFRCQTQRSRIPQCRPKPSSYLKPDNSQPKEADSPRQPAATQAENAAPPSTPLEAEPETYTSALYNKLSTMLTDFKGLIYSNRMVSAATAEVSQRRSNATDRFIAFIPNFTFPRPGFELSDAFMPEHDNFTDCFALFIENPLPRDAVDAPRISDGTAMDRMDSTLTCEVVRRLSKEILSESGPYQCVFEEEVDEGTPPCGVRKIMNDLKITSGRLRVFQNMRSLAKLRERRDVASGSADTPAGPPRCRAEGEDRKWHVGECFKHRLAALNEYLSRRSEGSPAAASLRNYFSTLRLRRTEDSPPEDSPPEDFYDENADHRLRDHVLMHTDHWGEFQYDTVETVLRDDQNSVVRLPYGCTVM
ncbi:bifunctional (p)ppGpp synthetase/guanosine-3',5'-bis(diphosphate) 3'-pyrophosphohydrolase [Babesia caballi]|uniref:Bifunctional (P)ppGpp synthetase/guanosine-3',5'-bis(Diphosphate) 3'-pyrophosphohydrolase n=1 Tax=Babesia caballi TaxID=5871 RepID=A0AAV4LNF3_BABCB|nr:bifunctional (p)ppGpp synthetase/guanosine-3',5'-bis(diphosphate) 3'-pyrophosphohydrolase [Babesia caballi]